MDLVVFLDTCLQDIHSIIVLKTKFNVNTAITACDDEPGVGIRMGIY